MNDLLINIARCPEIEKAKTDNLHPCHKIVNSQTGDTFQLPEPWNGDISKADILFIASNPSYNSEESFPNPSWDNNRIEPFFLNRFSDKYYQKIQFWASIKKYASWILNIPKDDDSLPGKICITEIVHCKSKSEIGVREACIFCTEKWLKEIINSFQGDYIVILGSVAKKLFPQHITGKTLIPMPHPNARGVTDEKRKEMISQAMKQ